jgi:hypothetical protein
MRAVLDLEPMFAPAGAIGMVEALRDNALEVHIAGDAELYVADIALFVLSKKDAIDRLG